VNRGVASAAAVAAVVLLNIGLLAVAWFDRSWLAFGVGVLYGPLANAAAAILLFFWSAQVGALPRSAAARAVLLGLLALAGTAADFLFVRSLTLHGC
jgi:hypothetical protein